MHASSEWRGGVGSRLERLQALFIQPDTISKLVAAQADSLIRVKLMYALSLH